MPTNLLPGLRERACQIDVPVQVLAPLSLVFQRCFVQGFARSGIR